MDNYEEAASIYFLFERNSIAMFKDRVFRQAARALKYSSTQALYMRKAPRRPRF